MRARKRVLTGWVSKDGLGVTRAPTARRMKVLLIPPMVLVELVLLAANWIVAIVNPAAGRRFMEWNLRTLPGREWYS